MDQSMYEPKFDTSEYCALVTKVDTKVYVMYIGGEAIDCNCVKAVIAFRHGCICRTNVSTISPSNL